ncbi:MAG: hypothetical protein ACW99U_18085 [Candidatus Thorarchaeota archaeon]
MGNETKGKLLFKDSEKFSRNFRVEWGILLSPTLIVVGVFTTLLGFWLISNYHPSLERIALSSALIFGGFTASIMGVLYTSAGLDARPMAIYENGLDIPIRPFKWQLKDRSRFIAFNDISSIERHTDEWRGADYYVINAKSGELLYIPFGSVSDMSIVRRLLAEFSIEVQYEEKND